MIGISEVDSAVGISGILGTFQTSDLVRTKMVTHLTAETLTKGCFLLAELTADDVGIWMGNF